MSQIQVTDLTFGYEGSFVPVFERVSFRLDTDWKLGFIGRNGRGKTTFLNLLMGKYKYEGTISVQEKFVYFPLCVARPEEMAVEAVRAALPDLEDWRLIRELNLLGADTEILYRPYASLSGGEQVKVQLAALFQQEDGFPLIDEPTNHLDAAGREAVGKYLSGKKGFILVSHDRAFLDSCIDHVLSINRADIEVQKGNFSTWQANRDRQDEWEQAEHEKLEKDLKRLSAAARKAADWSDKTEKTKKGTDAKGKSGIRPDRGFIGARSARMMKRAKTLEARRTRAVEEKAALLKNVEEAGRLAIHPMQYPKEILAEGRDISVRYGEKTVIAGVDVCVRRGDRVALCGENGSGKTSILKLLTGELAPSGGVLRVGSGLIISQVKQDTAALCGGLREFTREQGVDESLLKAILRKMGFAREVFETRMEEYSAGQKKKVLIAKSLCQPAHLYVWDEPLNYSDVLSRIQIEELLAQFAPTMVFVEHDRAFVERLATKIVRI